VTRDTFVPTLESAIGLCAPESEASIREALDGAVSRGRPFNLEVQFVRPDGEQRWVRTSGMRVEEGGQRRRLFGVVQDITEQRRLEQEIVLIAQREQIRIGSDLHDGLGQELTGIALMLSALSGRDLERVPVSRRELEQLEGVARQAIVQCRSLAQGVSPTGQELGGLLGATRHLAVRIEKMHGIVVRLHFHGRGIHGRELHLDDAVADHLYRIIQEAITNAIKHAAARFLVVSIHWNPRRTVVCVTNDGKGFGPTRGRAGLGLGIMRYRARLIGATLEIEPTTAGGTRIRCRLPNPPHGSTPRFHPPRIDAGWCLAPGGPLGPSAPDY
jgi:signal transduction histidine kinase